ncbi:MAG: phosphatase PAP2 family protein [Promethearchaeota archaeon]
MEFKDFQNKINKWDQKIILKYNGIGGKPLTYILKVLSFFGRETVWIFLIAFYLFIWYDPFLLSHLSAIFLIGLIMVVIIKKSVNRLRPFEKLGTEKIKVLEKRPKSKSFPSWHAYNIVAYGLLIGLFFLRSPLIIILMQGFAIIVSFSRIQLGVHYPSDVIFGYILGIIGFLFSTFILAPFFQDIIEYFEGFALHRIEYRQINSLVFENIWYLILWLLICVLIIISATYRHFKDGKREKKLKI